MTPVIFMFGYYFAKNKINKKCLKVIKGNTPITLVPFVDIYIDDVMVAQLATDIVTGEWKVYTDGMISHHDVYETETIFNKSFNNS